MVKGVKMADIGGGGGSILSDFREFLADLL